MPRERNCLLRTEWGGVYSRIIIESKMRILIGCEESQAVTLAFRERGFEAFSNDLKPSSGGHPEWHLQMDVIEAIRSRKWGFIGLHPVCTKMTLSGNRHYAPGKPRHQERLDAVEWTVRLWQTACASCDHVYMENPMGAMNRDARLPVPQIIHPYYFGDEFQKQTCLWLYGLPKLLHVKQDTLFDTRTHVGRGYMYEFFDNRSQAVRKMPMWYANAKGFGGKQLNKDFNEARSKTFPGIAAAMAVQWGDYLTTMH